MKHQKKYPSQKILNKLFKYKNGLIYWNNPPHGARKDGIAGRLNTKGHLRVCIDGDDYLVHRIIYTMFYGEIPFGVDIDHKDENKSNNLIDNLRQATNSQNKINSKRRSDNISGYKGVSFKSANNKWQASIVINGKNKYLGLFEDKETAAVAYRDAALLYHSEFANFK